MTAAEIIESAIIEAGKGLIGPFVASRLAQAALSALRAAGLEIVAKELS